jgi:hypothetical protein
VGAMRRTLGSGLVLLLLAGCATTPALDPPPDMPATAPIGMEYNPLYVGLNGPKAYSIVFENVLKVLHDAGFELAEHNRYDGRIKTLPRIAPGLGQLVMPGSPNPSERLLYTLQSYRHHAHVQIQPAEGGGFFIHVIVYKELEELPRPVRATAGAIFPRVENNVDRQFEVIDPTLFESNWIPKGRDLSLEQQILKGLRARM